LAPVPAARSRARWTYAVGASLFPGRSVIARPRRRLALLTVVPVALAVLAAFMVTVTSRSDDGELSGTECQIGFTVPAGFQGKVDMWIGRPARPGEQYQEAGSAFNRGEPLDGLADQIFDHPLSEVLPLLAQHNTTSRSLNVL
jgi:hypothetical protein